MFLELKSLAKHSAIYAVGNILRRFVGFLMIPVYTAYLTPADYGALELLILTVAVLGLFVDSSTQQAVLRVFFLHPEGDDRRRVVSTSAIANALVTAVVVCIGLLLSERLSRVIFGSGEHAGSFQIVLWTFLFQGMSVVPLAYLRATKRSMLFITVNSIELGVGFVLNLVFVVVLGLGVRGVLLSGLVSAIVTAAILVPHTWARCGWAFDSRRYRELLAYGLPLILGSLAIFVHTYSDRYFLKAFTSLDEVGLYSLGSKFATLLLFLLWQPFYQIWSAQQFEIARREDATRSFGRVFTLYNVVMLTAWLALSLTIREVLSLTASPSYATAWVVVPVLALGNIFAGGRYLLQVGLFVENRTQVISNISFAALGLNLMLNLTLIPRFGMLGAAWAVSIPFIATCVISHLVCRRTLPVQVEWGRLTFLVLAAAPLVVIGVALPEWPLWASLPVKGLLVLALPLALWMAGFFHPEERAVVASILGKVSLGPRSGPDPGPTA